MTLTDRIEHLKERFDSLRIVGGAGVSVYGDPRRGFAINLEEEGSEAEMPPNVPGCTDPEADNFDPSATVDDGSCEYLGACCSEGSCYEDYTEADCNTFGVFQGIGSTCEDVDVDCSLGACCSPDGSCEDNVAEEDCPGNFRGPGTSCADEDCLGACCFDGECFQDTEDNCGTYGDFKGIGVSCDDADCDLGACCYIDSCYADTESNCNTYGEWQGFISCEAANCLGACCQFDGSCDDVTESWCNAIGGEFQGTEFSCADDPCVIGACCSDSGCEGEFTETYCGSIGGTYAGDGTACADDVCPVCPDVSLVCDSITATKSKCGFFFDGKYYAVQDDDLFLTGSITNNGNCGYTDSEGVQHNLAVNVTSSWSVVRSDHNETNPPDCDTPINECIVSGGMTITTDQTEHCPAYCNESFTLNPACDLPNDTPGALSRNEISGSWYTYAPGGCSRMHMGTGSTSTTYSSEYTTDDLINDTEDALPAFSGTFDCSGTETGQGCDCSAFRNLTDDESSYSIQRFKYKFLFDGGSGDFVVTWDEVGPDGISPHVGAFSSGEIESPEYEVDEPSVNGTTTIENIECHTV